MAEKEAATGLAALLPYLWVLFSVPVGVIWRRLNGHAEAHDKLKDSLAEQRIYVAQHHFRKSEVVSIVQAAIKPVQETCDRIEKKMDRISERREHDRDHDRGHGGGD